MEVALCLRLPFCFFLIITKVWFCQTEEINGIILRGRRGEGTFSWADSTPAASVFLPPTLLSLFLVHSLTHTHHHRAEDVWMRGTAAQGTKNKKEGGALSTEAGHPVSMHLTQLNKGIVLKNDPTLDIYMILNDLFECHYLSDGFSNLQTV